MKIIVRVRRPRRWAMTSTQSPQVTALSMLLNKVLMSDSPFGKKGETVFFTEPEGEVVRRVAFLLGGGDAVGLDACVECVDAEEFEHRGVNCVPVIDEGYGFFCGHVRLPD